MTPRDKWNDERIDDLARQYREDVAGLRADMRQLDERLDGYSAGRRLTTVQIFGLILGFLGPIIVAMIAAFALIMTKGTP